MGGRCRTLTMALIAALTAWTGGCSLVLDFSELPDAAPEPNPLCDVSEPNDSIDQAVTIPAGSTTASLCGADVDHFEVVLGDLDDLTLSTAAAGPLDIELSILDGGQVVDTSDGAGSSEVIERSAAMGNRLGGGSYVVRIAPSANAGDDAREGDYSLMVTVETEIPIDAGVVDAMP